MIFNSEKLLIAEIKNARPNKEFHSKLSIVDRLKAYEKADAMSVVTHPSFSGSLDLLRQVRKLTNKPILAKDFIRTPEEATALKEAGGDGILLMKDMLTAQELNILVEHCKIIGAISFVESSFHFPEEGDFSVLNSRSLFSLQENKYFRDFISQTAPKNKDRTIIASSLETPLSVRLALSENRGCIVGSALMEKDASLKIMDFLEQCKRENILIKVCGARTSQDLELALNYKVDFIGINLIPTSKRFIGKENLKKLLPYLESIQEKICFITRIDTCPQCLELISHLKCAEQTYFTPLLPNRIMLFSSPHMNFIGSTALVLDGENPGSGLPTNYPLNKNNVSTPVFISAGITAHNFLEKKYEALEKGWNVVGIDCSSSVCVKNLEENLNSFSGDKMFNFMKEQQNYFITPLLEKSCEHLSKGFESYIHDKIAQNELKILLKDFCGRETPLTEAKNLGQLYGGKIFLKREDLLHGGAHKLNNAIAQCALAQYMGIHNIIAETGAGQHGVATAMTGAKLGLNVTVYQGEVDIKRQQLNALRMKLFGANLVPVKEGEAKLKEAVNAAFRAWVSSYKSHAYCIGSIVGPHPFPTMVRHFQKIIGEETRTQILEKINILPNALFACVGGGSNAAGFFTAFVPDKSVALVACEAEGAASLCHGTMGILHGMETLVLQTPERQIASTHSISAGLDYPAVGPWLAALKKQERLQSVAINDAECIEALQTLAKEEGILCALESAHAIAGAKRYLHQNPGKTVVICISGRGDKDLDSVKLYVEKNGVNL